MSLDKIYAMQITDGGLVDDYFDQVTDASYSDGVQALISSADGIPYDRSALVGQQIPVMSLTSEAIATCLDVAGVSGFDGTGCVAYVQKAASGGVRASGSNHQSITFAQCAVLPRSISADGRSGSFATIQYDIMGYKSDGTVSVSTTTGVALPSTSTTVQNFVAGPVSVNGTTIEAVTGIEINFGIAEQFQFGEGDAYPKDWFVDFRKPTISITCENSALLSTLGISGSAQTVDSVIYLRKCSPGGTRVLDATTEHIKITVPVSDTHIRPQSISGSHAGISQTTIFIQPVFDESEPSLTISTGSAIT